MSRPIPSPARDRRARRARAGAAGLRASCALAALLAATASVAAEPPSSVRVLLDATGPAPLEPDVTFAQLDDLLRRGPELDAGMLADGRTLPEVSAAAIAEELDGLSCGTPVMRAAERAAARVEGPRGVALARLVAGPRLAAERSVAVAGVPAVVRYDTSVGSQHAVARRDGDRNLLPDAADGLVADVKLAHERLVALTGWDGQIESDVLDVVLAETLFDEGAATWTQPRVVVPRTLRGGARLQAVAHQIAHLAVRDLAPDVPDGFEESVATWLAALVLADANGLDVPAGALLPRRHPARVLLSPGVAGARHDAELLRFVAAQLDGPDYAREVLAALPRHLDDARTRGGLAPAVADAAGVAEALDEVLAHRGWSLAEAVSEFQIWSLEQDMARHGAAASVDEEMDLHPAERPLAPAEIGVFGQVRLGMQLPASGALRLAFDGDHRLQATAVALLDDGRALRFEVPSRARGGLALPGGRLERLVLLVGSPFVPASWSGWPGTPDASQDATVSTWVDPAYPFVVAEIAAAVEPGQVTLTWETSSEEDLVGFWVERSPRPGGPWLPVSAVPFPASNWPGASASYAFVDAGLAPSTRYHYRVRGVTVVGLDETTATVVARTLPAAR